MENYIYTQYQNYKRFMCEFDLPNINPIMITDDNI